MRWPPDLRATRPVRAVPAACYAVVVLVASVVDPPAGGLTPTGPLGLVGIDKWFHVGGYATLAALLSYALWATTGRRHAVAVGLAITYGAGIEVVQSFLPYRAFGVGDLLANAVGAGLAGLALWLASRRRARGRDASASE
jgi:VanZ family protein